MHNKLLTADNLRRRGIEGPSRCALCNADMETTQHLFLHCKVSLQVWRSILHPVCAHFKPPDSLGHLLIAWDRLYTWTLRKKPNLKRLWNVIPKNICWQIRLARNRSIFKEEKVVISRIVSKTIGMTVEKLATRGLGSPDSEDILAHVSKWCGIFFQRSSPRSKSFYSI